MEYLCPLVSKKDKHHNTYRHGCHTNNQRTHTRPLTPLTPLSPTQFSSASLSPDQPGGRVEMIMIILVVGGDDHDLGGGRVDGQGRGNRGECSQFEAG